LGITNLDLFTYEKVLFVEGPSDVAVFMLVLNAMDVRNESERTKLVDLSGDGKLKRTRSAHRVKELLINASASKARVPVGFLLDSGGRSENEKLDLKKSLHDPPRSAFGLLVQPELENYLLEAKSIVNVIQRERALLGLEDDPGLESRVVAAINAGSEKGSTVLEKCFSSGIEGRAYRKTDDAPLIAAEIIGSNPSFLKPLYDEVRLFIEQIGTKEMKLGPE
jgi:hypothetical protein